LVSVFLVSVLVVSVFDMAGTLRTTSHRVNRFCVALQH
jgi:hypothetical protein